MASLCMLMIPFFCVQDCGYSGKPLITMDLRAWWGPWDAFLLRPLGLCNLIVSLCTWFHGDFFSVLWFYHHVGWLTKCWIYFHVDTWRGPTCTNGRGSGACYLWVRIWNCHGLGLLTGWVRLFPSLPSTWNVTWVYINFFDEKPIVILVYFYFISNQNLISMWWCCVFQVGFLLFEGEGHRAYWRPFRHRPQAVPQILAALVQIA